MSQFQHKLFYLIFEEVDKNLLAFLQNELENQCIQQLKTKKYLLYLQAQLEYFFFELFTKFGNNKKISDFVEINSGNIVSDNPRKIFSNSDVVIDFTTPESTLKNIILQREECLCCSIQNKNDHRASLCHNSTI